MIEVKDLTFSHPGACRPVLEGISFRVNAGEITTVLGPNGSGKTTLFQCMLGIWDRHEGEVLFDGRSSKGMKRQEIARNVAAVPQEHEPPFPYSVEDVVLMGRAAHVGLLSSPSRQDRERARKAMDTMGISALADRPYTRISGGERQMVLIARCLAQEAPAVLMDEPTAHLDFRNQITVLMKTRATVRKNGLAAVLNLHDPNMAILFSDRVLLLNGGKVVAEGKPGDVITKENIRAVYRLEVEFVSHGRFEMICPRLETAEDAVPVRGQREGR